ncbi:hypothetical protein SporoP37_02120 [Sporosarcina sp. P37]|uniref:helix-turn-helix transcriptional regulator n=1 Tax=unclassified Sporosarcina TaxID=2647733 RepID=UPI000A17B394|nr:MULTISPECIES: helix-turn-helix transcriptional regulator [unclassified Sporosarcina]ARK23604.1 hypothetical protein SporoP37_02120 [Sporosarcina sp. P37]PID18773.1 XRE family transcriptional regulator [Sporosarcina sp. P35]
MVLSPPKITLEAARINAGLSIVEAAEKIGVSRSSIINWERNSSNIKISYLDKIEQAYNYPVEYIFFGNTLEFKSS